ncbi:hypothetical protein NP493_25g04027 [Ridgeia piscesae]|uniref:Uncharacterized protein n=1 Tax=Ridgeia piscesae TaxID=27915 RepID=A0AAD9UKB0_RIDPI|nr:hypothetical protein NP493_25g04027 [Ridgeia piscesae]
MTAPLYKRSVCVLWITLCLFQVCQANCDEGSCLRMHPGWGSWYVWMGIAFILVCCCGTIASWCRHLKSKQRPGSVPGIAGITTVHVTSTSGAMLGVPDICSVPVDTTKSSTQPEPEAAARAPDMTVPGVAAKKPHREDEAADDVPPPAYCDVYPSPPLYCEVPPLPTYEEARDTSNPSVSRL